MRVFAAIEPPATVGDHLAQALAMVAPGGRAARNPWTPRQNWHVTLAFYGEQPEGALDDLAANLRAAARAVPPFDLALAGAGVFRHDACWIGVSDPGDVLGPLSVAVRGPWAVDDQRARNRFHLTVSRAGRLVGLEDAMAALAVYRGPAWTVDRIGLYRSDLGEGPGGHPRYTPLELVRLEDPA